VNAAGIVTLLPIVAVAAHDVVTLLPIVALTVSAVVVMLAGTIGERNTLYRRHLDQAAEHLTAELRGAGYAVREQAFAVDGVTVRNLETEQRGTTRPLRSMRSAA